MAAFPVGSKFFIVFGILSAMLTAALAAFIAFTPVAHADAGSCPNEGDYVCTGSRLYIMQSTGVLGVCKAVYVATCKYGCNSALDGCNPPPGTCGPGQPCYEP